MILWSWTRRRCRRRFISWILPFRRCDRKFGIGADGLLVVSREPDTEAAFRMRMFNPDGTEDMCGNGLRCVSLWAYRAGWLGGQTQFTVAAKDGRSAGATAVSQLKMGVTAELGVDMGVPQFDPENLPFCAAPLDAAIVRLSADGRRRGLPDHGRQHGQHAHGHFWAAARRKKTFQRVSPLIENHPLFPERTSVLWATPRDDDTVRHSYLGARRRRDTRLRHGRLRGRRGGACSKHLAAPNTPLDIVSKGGTLRITWPGEDAPVIMIGPGPDSFTEGDIALDLPA